jgi:hypothetical protein
MRDLRYFLPRPIQFFQRLRMKAYPAVLAAFASE